MTGDRTDRFALPLLLAGQAQKEITHNEALTLLDIAACAVVESADVAIAPAGPSLGQCWIVAAGATGAWEGHAGEIAGWTGGGWRFVVGVQGMEVWVIDRGHAVRRTDSDWIDGAVREDGFYQAGVKVIGPQADAIGAPAGGAVIDVECRAAIAAILEMLQLHGMIASTP